MIDRASNSQLDFRGYIYASYAETHAVYGDPAKSASPGRRAQLETALRRWLPSRRDARILDFGCGDGALLSVAKALGYTALAECTREPVHARAKLSIREPKAAVDDAKLFGKNVQRSLEQHQRREDRTVGRQAGPLVAGPQLLEQRLRSRGRR